MAFIELTEKSSRQPFTLNTDHIIALAPAEDYSGSVTNLIATVTLVEYQQPLFVLESYERVRVKIKEATQ